MPQMNFFDAELIENAGKYQVEVDGVRVELSEEKEKNLAAKGVKSQKVTLGIRPEHISLSEPGAQAVTGKIDVAEMMGSAIHLHPYSSWKRYNHYRADNGSQWKNTF